MRRLLAKIVDRTDRKYPQTWPYVVYKPRWLRSFLRWLCGVFKHELSKTEWGYGGGQYVDRWCRWCGKLIQVPKESVYFQFPHAKKFMGVLTAVNPEKALVNILEEEELR